MSAQDVTDVLQLPAVSSIAALLGCPLCYMLLLYARQKILGWGVTFAIKLKSY
jgi:hypothetical protein